ncbi:hypothetical protein DET54_12521 [Paenibacillus pabuli]|uniref:MAE-28990/MAE-18760-like HEPN domain-containing protein n=1 Tax=Paenibacillus pabuli TaxID=1472 RepID=A0ABX9BBJ8_9BACL|nr:MAE_28990/MAE_18760 family HEPN-like nuclease [Paenibacillus pabuli]RAI84443.1 hypothetical protein DET54_12521 [Paenibacillus pabuli]
MTDLNHIFSKRTKEINDYLAFIEIMIEGNTKIESADGEVIKVTGYISSSLKASLFLMLYNLIESTVSRSIESIHNVVTTEGLTYSEINHQIKQLWLDYYLSNQDAKISKLAIDFISGSFSKKKVNIEFRDYVNKKTIFSGNLDALKIREISASYGFAIRKKKLGEKLVVVKSLRNKLAHGDLSFTECGRDYVISQLKSITKDVINFLEYFLKKVEEFIEHKKYKIVLHENQVTN